MVFVFCCVCAVYGAFFNLGKRAKIEIITTKNVKCRSNKKSGIDNNKFLKKLNLISDGKLKKTIKSHSTERDHNSQLPRKIKSQFF